MQRTFEGSDRQGRGRLVEALRQQVVEEDALPEVMGWPEERDRAVRVATGLVKDGLVELSGNKYALTSAGG